MRTQVRKDGHTTTKELPVGLETASEATTTIMRQKSWRRGAANSSSGELNTTVHGWTRTGAKPAIWGRRSRPG